MWSENPEVVALYRRLQADKTGAEIFTPKQLAAINTDIDRQLTGPFVATLNMYGNLLLLQFRGTFRGRLLVDKILPYLSRIECDDYVRCSDLRWQKAKQLAGPQREIKLP